MDCFSKKSIHSDGVCGREFVADTTFGVQKRESARVAATREKRFIKSSFLWAWIYFLFVFFIKLKIIMLHLYQNRGNIFSISDFCWIVKHFLDTFDRCEKMQKICFFLSIKSEKKRKTEKDKKTQKINGNSFLFVLYC